MCIPAKFHSARSCFAWVNIGEERGSAIFTEFLFMRASEANFDIKAVEIVGGLRVN